MRYYLDTQNLLLLFQSNDCTSLLDLGYLRRKCSKIYLNILCGIFDDSGRLAKLKVELLIPNEENIIGYLTPIIFNLIIIEDYNFELLDGRFNQQEVEINVDNCS